MHIECQSDRHIFNHLNSPHRNHLSTTGNGCPFPNTGAHHFLMTGYSRRKAAIGSTFAAIARIKVAAIATATSSTVTLASPQSYPHGFSKSEKNTIN